ncbi:hypothetical protein [Pseudactinotalea suaedae]|uniref:hypothetical protein n=1 Tax=Pseudactinotalea suaedae TaxID=1524924 RepID=UPI0012E235E9|nr:hypothetical protein [Pseudactinotalea suaedae]
MTTTRTAPTSLEPGWLGRAWFRHLEAEALAGVSRPSRHEYMCSSGMAEVVEPFVRPFGDGGADLDDRILPFDGVDGAAAAELLEALPEVALEQEYSSYAPAPRRMLTAVVESGGTVTCGGDLITPALPSGGMRVLSLTVREPDVLDVEPDLVAGELPDWLEELPAAARRRYVGGRQQCVDHGITRQVWMLVSNRYGIDDARMFPRARFLIDDDGARIGVRFQW